MTHRLAVIGVVLLSVAITGVVLLIFDVVAGRTAGLVAAAGVALLLATLWAAVPRYARGLNDRECDAEPDEPRPPNHSMS